MTQRVQMRRERMNYRAIFWRSIVILPITFALYFSWVLNADLAKAHNNPGFKEVLLTTIEVNDQPLSEDSLRRYSDAFSLELPKKAIELIWRIADDAGEGIIFAVAQGDKLHAEGLVSGDNSRILRGDDIQIVNVEGASAPFRLEIFANVIDRSKTGES
jgi:hypothetical protein